MSLLQIQHLIDDAKCFQTVRELRWPDGVRCPHCHGDQLTKRGFDDTQPDRQRYLCKGCQRQFDDLTDTVFASHHQRLKIWILCLYFMGLNLSKTQIAKELNLNKDDVHQMTTQLREGIVLKKPTVLFADEVECDEVYVIAGHKGKPGAIKKRPKTPQATPQGPARPRHTRQREASHIRHD